MSNIQSLLQDIAVAERRSLPVLKSAPTDCNGCGHCCEFFADIDVYIEEPGFQWLKDRDLLTEDNLEAMYAMKRVEGTNRCVALVGKVGKDAHCSIYENRPEGCRVFEAGGSRCRSVLIMSNYDCYMRTSQQLRRAA